MRTTSAGNTPAATLFGLARRRLLGLFFARPRQSYYLRQASRLTRLGLGATQRELGRLSAAGILRRTVQGRQVYFQAEQDCPIFEELKSLLAKTMGVREVLHSALQPLREKIRAAFIYGSFAEGREGPESDVDLMVVGEASFEAVVAALAPAEEILRREINPTVYPRSEFGAKRRAGHYFLRAVLAGPKIFVLGDSSELAGLGARRMARRAPQRRGRNSKPAGHRGLPLTGRFPGFPRSV